MKYLIIATVILSFVLVGCTKQDQSVSLIEGTPAYTLAKEISAIVPAVDPSLNPVLVVTKDFSITAGEVIQTIQSSMGNRANQLATLEAAQVKDILLQNAEQIAQQKLLMAAAEKAGISAAPDAIKNALQEQYTMAGGEEKFLEVLATNGMDLEFVKSSIESNLVIEKYLEDVFTDEIQVSEDELQKVYQEDKTASVRHILLLTQGKSEDEKAEILKKMEGLLDRVKGGEDFSELANEYSEDPGSNTRGGLYENFGRGQMVPPFEEASFSVPVGEVSDIVETTYGYHIIQVVDRQKETRPLEEVRAELEETLKQSQQNEAFQAHMTQLKDAAAFELKSLDEPTA
jgi:parvulin-like peptidyl-prolyl isomerase